MKKNNNIFELLNNIDINNYDYFDSLTKEDQSKISFFMLIKWLAMSDSAEKLLLLNSSVNKQLFSLSKYPKLLFHTLASIGNGNSEFYKWKKKEIKDSKRPQTVKILKEYYNISNDEAITCSELMNLDTIIAMAEDLGYIDNIKYLRKEY